MLGSSPAAIRFSFRTISPRHCLDGMPSSFGSFGRSSRPGWRRGIAWAPAWLGWAGIAAWVSRWIPAVVRICEEATAPGEATQPAARHGKASHLLAGELFRAVGVAPGRVVLERGNWRG